MADKLTRNEMHAMLNASPGSAMFKQYCAAISGFAANPCGLRPREIVELALDVCIEDVAYEQVGPDKAEG